MARVVTRRTGRAVGAPLLLLTLAGCMMQMDPQGVRVSRAEFGERWPLTVATGILRCERSDEITFQWRGSTYALTGRTEHSAYSDIHEIWADGQGGRRKPLAPLVDRGRELCE